MAKIVWDAGALMAPVPPVMVTTGEGEHANIITVAWTGIVATRPCKTYVSIRPQRYSYELLKQTGECAICLTTAGLIRAADWCGMHTGRKTDKFEACHLTKQPAEKIACPLIAESPLCLECKVTDVIPMGSHDMFLLDVLAVDVEDTLIDANGKLRLEKAGLAAFAHGDYFGLGKKIGYFGFSVKKRAGGHAEREKPRGKNGNDS